MAGEADTVFFPTPPGGPIELTEDASSRYRFEHHASLDGFRGIAALVVVCYHTDQVPHFVGAGQAAMEMFFVLSGFLITSVLRREHAAEGRIGISAFYRRRFQRLAPALVLYVVAATVVAAATGWWAIEATLQNGAASVSYTANWLQLHFTEVPVIFGQTWSLAVEEQYYLTWPLVLSVLLLLPTAVRLRALAILLAAALAWRWWVVGGEVDLARIRNGTDVRAFALIAGSALAFALDSLRIRRLLAHPANGVVAGGALLASFFLPDAYTSGMFVSWMFVSAAATALLIGHVVVRESSGVTSVTTRLLSTAPLVALGAVSYTLYLWHPLAIECVARTLGTGRGAVADLLTMLVTSLAVSVPAYLVAERQYRSRRRARVGAMTVLQSRT